MASPKNKTRISEAISSALKDGKGNAEARSSGGKLLFTFSEGLRSKVSGKIYTKLEQNGFSFNSPTGACPRCKGFGHVIEINPHLVIPNSNFSLRQGAIKPFEGKVYGHCLQDLLSACDKLGVDKDLPWNQLSQKNKDFIWNGDPMHQKGDDLWYGIKSFFKWLEKKTYKMHVRVFLSKYRGYFSCDECNGKRFRQTSQLWKWKGFSLPDLYSLPISELLSKLRDLPTSKNPKTDIPLQAICTRLGYLEDVGLGYLSLDRSSRTLVAVKRKE